LCPVFWLDALYLLECIQNPFVRTQKGPMTKSIPGVNSWPDPQTQEAEQVQAACQNPQAFTALYDRYVRSIYCYLYSRVGLIPEAEDLTAQTFLSALESLPRYQHRGYFSAWLFSIARSKAMDYFRQRQNVILDESFYIPGPDLLASLAQQDELEHLLSLVSTLPENDRELIRLRYVAEMSFREMAALLGKKEEAVKKSLYRLLARLQSQLEASHE
jgi:RNA polymerase sigma-70 factor, ECF subfamily